MNRLRRLRVPNRTRRLLEPTRSCRDPQIPPLPRRLTGRFPLGGFLRFPTIGSKSSPSSLLLSHWTVGRVLPPPRFETGRCSESPTHHILYDWGEGRTSATPIGHLSRQSWPRWPRPLVLFFLEISTSPIGLTDSVTEPPSDLKKFQLVGGCRHFALVGLNCCPSKSRVGFLQHRWLMGVRGHRPPLQWWFLRVWVWWVRPGSFFRWSAASQSEAVRFSPAALSLGPSPECQAQGSQPVGVTVWIGLGSAPWPVPESQYWVLGVPKSRVMVKALGLG